MWSNHTVVETCVEDVYQCPMPYNQVIEKEILIACRFGRFNLRSLPSISFVNCEKR